MRHPILLLMSLLVACAGEQPYDPLEDYAEVDAATIVDAPAAEPSRFAPADRDRVIHGEYLVELLGCGACHTDGALEGAPELQRALGGSSIGIAWSNPLGTERPGVVFPSNITPDVDTGIGAWSNEQIANAIRAGVGRHGSRRIQTMPWQGYARISNDDVDAMVAYLRSIPVVQHRVPANVEPGERTTESFVYFGVYRKR